MAGRIPPPQQGWRARLAARWRLTRRGRVVVASLGVLLVVFVGSLVESTARHPPPAKGLPATRPTVTDRRDRNPAPP